MKSYLQGLIKGGALVFAIFVLLGGANAPETEPIGRYIPMGGSKIAVIDTKTGNVLIPYDKNDTWTGHDAMHQITNSNHQSN